MNSPDPVALVKEAVLACKYRSYIAVVLRSVPHVGNRLWLAKWVVHRFRDVGAKTSSIYRSLHGPTYYLQGLGQTSIEAATLEEFQSIWITAIHAPTRTFEQCQKGPLTPRTRRDYQRECQRFLAWALGAEQAAAKASFTPSALDGPDPVSRTVPWEKLFGRNGADNIKNTPKTFLPSLDWMIADKLNTVHLRTGADAADKRAKDLIDIHHLVFHNKANTTAGSLARSIPGPLRKKAAKWVAEAEKTRPEYQNELSLLKEWLESA